MNIIIPAVHLLIPLLLVFVASFLALRYIEVAL